MSASHPATGSVNPSGGCGDASIQSSHSTLSVLLRSTDIRKEILRGARLSSILQRQGALWRTSPVDLRLEDRSKLWQISDECEALEFFISQSWHSPGWQRYITLLIRFYWLPAAATGFFAFVALVVLDGCSLIPSVDMGPLARAGWEGHVRYGPWYWIPPLVSLLALFAAPSIPGLRDYRVFFDAVCIHQSEESLKLEGVYSLGGFVRHSEEFIALWSPSYFRRAWCTFEFAIFSLYKPDSALHFCPLFEFVAMLVGYCLASVACVVFSLAYCLGQSLPLPAWVLALSLCVLPLPPMIHKIRQNVMEKNELITQIEHFSLERAECRDGSDLDLMIEIVERLYGSTKCFNDSIRETLRGKVQALREFELQYTHLLAMASPLINLSAQYIIGYARARVPILSWLSITAGHLGHAVFTYPATLKLIFVMCAYFPKQHNKIWANLVCSSCIAIVSCWFPCGMIVVSNFLSNRMMMGGLMFLFCCLACTPATFFRKAFPYRCFWGGIASPSRPASQTVCHVHEVPTHIGRCCDDAEGHSAMPPDLPPSLVADGTCEPSLKAQELLAISGEGDHEKV